MFIELCFAQIWSFCRRKTAAAEVLLGGVEDSFYTVQMRYHESQT